MLLLLLRSCRRSGLPAARGRGDPRGCGSYPGPRVPPAQEEVAAASAGCRSSSSSSSRRRSGGTKGAQSPLSDAGRPAREDHRVQHGGLRRVGSPRHQVCRRHPLGVERGPAGPGGEQGLAGGVRAAGGRLVQRAPARGVPPARQGGRGRREARQKLFDALCVAPASSTVQRRVARVVHGVEAGGDGRCQQGTDGRERARGAGRVQRRAARRCLPDAGRGGVGAQHAGDDLGVVRAGLREERRGEALGLRLLMLLLLGLRLLLLGAAKHHFVCFFFSRRAGERSGRGRSETKSQQERKRRKTSSFPSPFDACFGGFCFQNCPFQLRELSGEMTRWPLRPMAWRGKASLGPATRLDE